METAAPPSPLLLTTTDIADRIAKTRGKCNSTSVWRVIRKLKIPPAQSPGRNRIMLYTAADADKIEQELRAPNKGKAKASA